MAHYRIKEGESGVAVEVTALAGRGEELMQAIGACQAGECSCPTDEYQKLASLEVDQSADVIKLSLVAKPGQTLVASEIAACLDYTIKKLDQ